MKINDVVYGEEEINEQVLIDLINSRDVQRLKGIAQFGIPDEYYYKKGFSRYDHSIGVLILLRRLGAKLKEQIAGLLHDVSHTSFSHVIDWVIGDPTKEDYQDKIHEEVIKNSEIPKILEHYGINWERISDVESFSLLEQEIPKLCADRIDYTLRELEMENKLEKVNFILFDLINKNEEIVFKSKEVAEFFAKEYARLQRDHWAGLQARMSYYVLADVIKEAMQKNIISFEDFVKTDREVIDLLILSEDISILKKLNLLKKGFETIDSKSGIRLPKKFRYVDPAVLIENTVKNLTEIVFSYKNFIELEKQNAEKIEKVLIVEK